MGCCVPGVSLKRSSSEAKTKKGMDDMLDTQVNFKCSSKDKALWDAAADAEGKTLSAFIKEALYVPAKEALVNKALRLRGGADRVSEDGGCLGYATRPRSLDGRVAERSGDQD